MNWFKFAQILLAVGGQAINLFVKNPQSKKVADAVHTLAGGLVDGLANQNPDGTPATTPYVPPKDTQ